MRLTRDESNILSHLASKLRRDFGAVEVLLYGSAVRGELTKDSDLDLLVVLPSLDAEIERRVIGSCIEAEQQCERIISPACFDEQELTQGPLRASPFVINARQEGVAL
jgi:predicted nucleotidyltransferase